MLARRNPSTLFLAGAGTYDVRENGQIDTDLRALYEDYTTGAIGRRDFMRRAAALGAAGAAAAALGLAGLIDAMPPVSRSRPPAAAAKMPLDVAEWSYMWVNVKRAETARGAFVGGQQMYVEYMIPSAGPSSVPGRARARRRRSGHGLDGNA